MTEETCPENDLRKAFVAGAKWRTEKYCLTWWMYDQYRAEEEAEKRYGSQVAENLKKEILGE